MTSILKESVMKALRDIDKTGISKKNCSREYCLVEQNHYPPKEVLRRAYLLQTGKKLTKLHGGEQTNAPLRKAGAKIIPHRNCGNTCKIV